MYGSAGVLQGAPGGVPPDHLHRAHGLPLVFNLEGVRDLWCGGHMRFCMCKPNTWGTRTA